MQRMLTPSDYGLPRVVEGVRPGVPRLGNRKVVLSVLLLHPPQLPRCSPGNPLLIARPLRSLPFALRAPVKSEPFVAVHLRSDLLAGASYFRRPLLNLRGSLSYLCRRCHPCRLCTHFSDWLD